jgi:tetratricopeptide (TPR) repeat protein
MMPALLLALICGDPLPAADSLVELNRRFCSEGRFDEAVKMLGACEEYAPVGEKGMINYLIAEDHLFAGKIIDARQHYLMTAARFSGTAIANDALDRLYLIEVCRRDTALMKRLVRALCCQETSRLVEAEESLKILIPTALGDYALYFTALNFEAQNRIPLALSALHELAAKFPGHTIHAAGLLAARLQVQLKNYKAAGAILESLIVEKPETIYAVQARAMLKELDLRRP